MLFGTERIVISISPVKPTGPRTVNTRRQDSIMKNKRRISKDPAPIPSVVHTGGPFSWICSKKARAQLFGGRTSGRDRQVDLAKLTRTQRVVYPMLEDARTNKQIAEKLVVSDETAKRHVHNILTKLHLKSRSELVNS